MGLRSAAESLGVSEYFVVHLKVNAGDAAFNHGGTWHGSGRNQTENAISCIINFLQTSIESMYYSA